MKILVAPDSFKNSLTAIQVGESIRKGIMQVPGKWEVRVVPLADGGEGTVEALVDATKGVYIETEVFDPLMRPVKARFGILGTGDGTAVIEMASSSGIELLKPEEMNPWITTTYGTGQLIKKALDEGCKEIIIGLGGSATIDGGMGMARALGFEFLNGNSALAGEGGGALSEIVKINVSNADRRLKDCKIIAACDVTNPLTGPEGASLVYGPQKGADHDIVLQLDVNLKHFASVIREQLGTEVESVPGSGAAGGMAAGLMAFAGACLKQGFSLVREIVHLDSHVQWADIVITGEGKMDFQTQFGKTPAGVAAVAKKYGKTIIAVTGTLGTGYSDLYKSGFSAVFSVIDRPMSLEEAIKDAPSLIERCAANIASFLLIKPLHW